MPLKSFSASVVGAPYPNSDGSNRQFEIKLCDRGERCDLLPEPKNKFDEHAVAVFSSRGVQIGYVSSERAVYVGGLIRAGHHLTALFQEETPWGAALRVGVDCEPDLPPLSTFQPRQHGQTSGADDSGFYPDPIYPDE